MGRSVTLSSTEAECEVDNVGAIYMANNYTISQRNSYVDTRYHFVRNYVEDGILKVVFVRSEDNDADTFTDSPIVDLFQKHRCKFLGRVEFRS